MVHDPDFERLKSLRQDLGFLIADYRGGDSVVRAGLVCAQGMLDNAISAWKREGRREPVDYAARAPEPVNHESPAAMPDGQDEPRAPRPPVEERVERGCPID